jgi:hypothetical protein
MPDEDLDEPELVRKLSHTSGSNWVLTLEDRGETMISDD